MSAPEAAASARPLVRMPTHVLVMTVIVVCSAFSSQMVMPLWIGAVIDDYGLTPEVAGRIASIEFITVAIVSLLVAARVHTFNVRTLSMLGLVCLLLGNGGAIYASDVTLLTVCRAFAGLGKGLIVAGIFSLVARTAHPTRSFAILNGSYAAFSAGFYLVVPYFIERNGASGAFFIMFVITLVGSLLVFSVPSGDPERTAAGTRAGRGTIELGGVLVLLALVFMWTGNSAIWTFIERIGVRSGLAVTQIGAVLSLSALLTVLGPAMAHVLHTRFGYGRPLITGLVLKIGVAAILCNVVSVTVFVASAPFLNLIALFIVPYLMGLMSIADPKGRLAAAAAAAMTAGGSLGSYVGGVALTHAGFAVLSAVAISFLLVVIVLVQLAVRQVPEEKLEDALVH